MVEAIVLESFVTAIACLCASSYGPNIKPKTDIRENIFNKITSWDHNVLTILLNSNRRFSFEDDSQCTLPDKENLNFRLSELEYEVRKQMKLTEKLMQENKNLSKVCEEAKKETRLFEIENKEEQIMSFQKLSVLHENYKKSKEKEIENLTREYENEILKLRKELETLKEPKQPIRIPDSKNGCLSAKEHGVSNVKICMKQDTFCAKNLDSKHGDGWMLLSQRFNGITHFYRNWADYADGFGTLNVDSEFFVGLNHIYTLTKNSSYELLFILTDIYNQTKYAHYDNFSIGGARENYALKSLGKYAGDAGDSLSYHVGQKFSTFDRNLKNCANRHIGAWWYKIEDCHKSNLFGLYRTKRPKNDFHKLNGMIWSTFHNTDDGSLLSMRMYFRPKEDKNILLARIRISLL